MPSPMVANSRPLVTKENKGALTPHVPLPRQALQKQDTIVAPAAFAASREILASATALGYETQWELKALRFYWRLTICLKDLPRG